MADYVLKMLTYRTPADVQEHMDIQCYDNTPLPRPAADHEHAETTESDAADEAAALAAEKAAVAIARPRRLQQNWQSRQQPQQQKSMKKKSFNSIKNNLRSPWFC